MVVNVCSFEFVLFCFVLFFVFCFVFCWVFCWVFCFLFFVFYFILFILLFYFILFCFGFFFVLFYFFLVLRYDFAHNATSISVLYHGWAKTKDQRTQFAKKGGQKRGGSNCEEK